MKETGWRIRTHFRFADVEVEFDLSARQFAHFKLEAGQMAGNRAVEDETGQPVDRVILMEMRRILDSIHRIWVVCRNYELECLVAEDKQEAMLAKAREGK